MRAKINYTLNGENESIELEGSKKDIDRGIREIQNIVCDVSLEWSNS
jgi:hypothetical protein